MSPRKPKVLIPVTVPMSVPPTPSMAGEELQSRQRPSLQRPSLSRARPWYRTVSGLLACLCAEDTVKQEGLVRRLVRTA